MTNFFKKLIFYAIVMLLHDFWGIKFSEITSLQKTTFLFFLISVQYKYFILASNTLQIKQIPYPPTLFSTIFHCTKNMSKMLQ